MLVLVHVKWPEVHVGRLQLLMRVSEPGVQPGNFNSTATFTIGFKSDEPGLTDAGSFYYS